MMEKVQHQFLPFRCHIGVGYKVNSFEATQFRNLATNTLKEYIKKGFIVNSKLLKIKEIRTSERRFY